MLNITQSSENKNKFDYPKTSLAGTAKDQSKFEFTANKNFDRRGTVNDESLIMRKPNNQM